MIDVSRAASGESELVALEESVTRSLQLVRQARIEGCIFVLFDMLAIDWDGVVTAAKT
jgi:hypothetical protein